MKCDVSVFEVPYIWLRREAVGGATRNNLIFNDVCIFRVGDPVTLKMLNTFIVSLLRGAPNGKPFRMLTQSCRWNTWAK